METTAADDSLERPFAEVDGREHGSDTSRSEPIARKSNPEVPVSIIHPESSGRRPEVQELPTPLQLPPGPFDYKVPGGGSSRPYLPPSYTRASRYQSHQPGDNRTPPYGHSQGQYSPYPYYSPLGNAPPPPPDLPHAFPDDTRIVEHRFAGFLFNIRTDAEVSSKRLRVKAVDNHIEYSCSGVLLTKIKYKFEKDIFSLYEDPDKDQLRDVKLCEKIEILMGPIVAGLFEKPWSPKDVNVAWGVRGCEDIGDGSSFHVDVLRDVDDRDMYHSQSRQSQPSPIPRSRPVVADMDAFHRIPSVEGVGDLSRSPYVQRPIDRTQLLNVLRDIELLTAIELAKQSYLTGSAVASVIGRKDYDLADNRSYRTFTVEVPTLFGLFVSKLPCWILKTSDYSSYSLSEPYSGRKYGYDEEVLRYQPPNGKESSTTPNSEAKLSAGSDLFTLSAIFPVAPNQSASHGEVDSGSEDEDYTSLDGESLASGEDPFVQHDVDSSLEDDEEGSLDRQSQASDEDRIAHLDKYNDDLSIGADASYTQRIPATPMSNDDSHHELSIKPASTFLRQPPLPNFTAAFHNVGKTNYHDAGSGGKKGETSSPESVSHTGLQSFENEDTSSKDGVTSSSGSPSHRMSLSYCGGDEHTTNTEDLSPRRPAIPEKPKNNEQHMDAQTDHEEFVDSDITIQSSSHVKGGQSHEIRSCQKQVETLAGNGNSSHIKASSDEVREKQKKQECESQEGERKCERIEGDGDPSSEVEGNTNSLQDNPPNTQNSVSHACSAQETHMKSQNEYQSENEGVGMERENSDKNGLDTDSLIMQQGREESDTALKRVQIISRNPRNRQTEEGSSRLQASNDEETTDRDKVSRHGSGDIRRDPVSILRKPRYAHHDVEKTGKKVMFTVPSSVHSSSDGENQRIELEEERHKDEFNEARRAHLMATYLDIPLRNHSPAYSYLPHTSSPQSSPYSPSSSSSLVEPYQEAVAAGQIYDVPSYISEEPMKHGSSSHRISGRYGMYGSHHHHTTPTITPPSPGSETSDLDSLPTPATSSKRLRLFSRKSSYKPMHDSDLSSLSTYYSYTDRRRQRIPLLIAKDTLSVILGVVIVMLSILAVALDPAEEENWFKRVEEGVFVMFSLGIPLLLAMRSRLTENLEIKMPKLKREVRSIRDLEKLNKRTDRGDFVKQLQRELLFNEELSSLFSPRDACYKLSRRSGNLVVPERAEYKKVFKEVWFFGEELAYNKVLGKAFRYKQEDNVLMIENESVVDIEGVIVHVRRRRGKYTFGSNSPEN